MADEEMIVEIPNDLIALGYDADGLPKTVLAEEQPAPPEKAVEEAKPEPTFSDADYARAQKQAEELRAAADAARKEVEEARAARLKAEEELALKDNALLRAHYARVSADQGTIEATIANWEAAAEVAKREMILAREAGDTAAESEAIRKMQRAENSISKLEESRHGAQQAIAEAERALTAPAPEKPKREDPAPKQITPDDWVKDARAKAGDKIGDWFEKNREFVTNPNLHQAAMTFINYQTMRGKPINSDAFIRSLNKEFLEDETAMATEDDATHEAKPQETKPASAKTATRAPSAAPVSRNGSYFSSSNMNAAQVKLPPKLAAFVRASGLDPVKYALGAVEDIKAGKLPKNFLDPDYDHQF